MAWWLFKYRGNFALVVKHRVSPDLHVTVVSHSCDLGVTVSHDPSFNKIHLHFRGAIFARCVFYAKKYFLSWSISGSITLKVFQYPSWIKYTLVRVKLTPLSRVLEMLSWSRNSPPFMEPKGSLLCSQQPATKTCVTFRNTPPLIPRREVVSPLPNPKLEYQSLSTVHECLLDTFAATLQIWKPPPPSATRRHTSCSGGRGDRDLHKVA